MIHHCGVATKPKRWHFRSRTDADSRHCRSISIDFDGKFVIPVHLGFLTFLDAHTVCLAVRKIDGGIALVYDKAVGAEFSFLCDGILYKQSARFGTHCGVGLLFFRTDGHSDPVVAVRHIDREIKDAIGKAECVILLLTCFVNDILKVKAISTVRGIHIGRRNRDSFLVRPIKTICLSLKVRESQG